MTNVTCVVCGEVCEKENDPEPVDLCNNPDCWLAYMLRQQGE